MRQGNAAKRSGGQLSRNAGLPSALGEAAPALPVEGVEGQLPGGPARFTSAPLSRKASCSTAASQSQPCRPSDIDGGKDSSGRTRRVEADTPRSSRKDVVAAAAGGTAQDANREARGGEAATPVGVASVADVVVNGTPSLSHAPPAAEAMNPAAPAALPASKPGISVQQPAPTASRRKIPTDPKTGHAYYNRKGSSVWANYFWAHPSDGEGAVVPPAVAAAASAHATSAGGSNVVGLRRTRVAVAAAAGVGSTGCGAPATFPDQDDAEVSVIVYADGARVLAAGEERAISS